MGMLLSAKEEVHKETNNKMAEVVAKKMHRREVARAKSLKNENARTRGS